MEQGNPNSHRWLCWPKILLAGLFFAGSCSREPPPTLFGAQQPVAFRLVATWDVDAEIAVAAQDITGRFVIIDEQVCGEWVPISDSVPLDGKQVANAVTRSTSSQTEVLVLHTVNDISENEIAGLKSFRDNASRDVTAVTLTAAGAPTFFKFTLLHRGDVVAVIVDGEVCAFPQIVSPVSSVMILTPEEIDKVRLVPTSN